MPTNKKALLYDDQSTHDACVNYQIGFDFELAFLIAFYVFDLFTGVVMFKLF